MDSNPTSPLVTLPLPNEYSGVVELVVNSLTSEHSRRAYSSALLGFLAWWNSAGRPTLSKAVIQRYRATLQDAGYAPSSINLQMSAIRKLAEEASDNGLLDQTLAAGIAKVHGVHQAGVRSGNWLELEVAKKLLRAPDRSTLAGKRDHAILAVMIGAGLRRAEVSRLAFEHIQKRDGRWVIIDLVGKRNRVRSIPIPDWVYQAIRSWTRAAGLSEGRIFRRVNRFDKTHGKSITPQAVYFILEGYAQALGIDVAPHDLRRTFAKLAHKGGARLDQIQLTLGHESIKTTERYLGVEQDLEDAPCDYLGI